MDLPRFISDNRRDWARLESLLERVQRSHLSTLSSDELRDLGQLHRKVSADLATARTLAPRSRISRSLNELALRSHNAVYQAPPRRLLSAVSRLAARIPATVRRRWGAVATAAGFLATGLLLGGVGTVLDESLAEFLLGTEFVQNVRQGEYWVAQVFEMMHAGAAVDGPAARG